MESRFKMRVSRIFRSSLASCKPRNITDQTEKPVFIPHAQNQTHRQHYQLIELFSPNPHPFPSLCRPKWPNSFNTDQTCIITKNSLARTILSEQKTLLVSADIDGRKCPPASPISPFNTYQEFQTKPKERKPRKPRCRKRHSRSRTSSFQDFPECKYNGLFSSDEEDDKTSTTIFSSRSISSESSDALQHKNKAKKPADSRRKTNNQRVVESASLVPMQGGAVKDSLAVVKRSSDPYSDFRTSMVEMIVEKQIFATKDLENMLQCFLSLNSYHHHKVIIEVFTEIWQALFCNNS